MPQFEIVRIGFRRRLIDADNVNEALDKAPSQEFPPEDDYEYTAERFAAILDRLAVDPVEPSVTLKDVSGGKRSILVGVRGEGDNAGLLIRPDGYGCCNCDDGTTGPVYLEVHEGRLRLIVWADINDEEPTHIIDLEGAREERRNQA